MPRKIHRIQLIRHDTLPKRLSNGPCDECGKELGGTACLQMWIPQGKAHWPNYYLCPECCQAFAENLTKQAGKLNESRIYAEVDAEFEAMKRG